MEDALRDEVATLADRHGEAPGLTVLLVGDDPGSQVYVGHKEKACRRVGIDSKTVRLPVSTTEEEVVRLVQELNDDPKVDGILVQLPLPAHISKGRILRTIVPAKDVDAFHAENVGYALIGDERQAPCTPQGILHLLDDAGIAVKGAEVCIINHSNIVGKPLAAMLINRDATVTVCHRFTRDVAAHSRTADIVVTGTGGHRRLQAQDIREGAVVVDVSMCRDEEGNLHGDVLPDVWDKASWVTPVPGGVGPMTIAVLLQNTVRSFKRRVAATA